MKALKKALMILINPALGAIMVLVLQWHFSRYWGAYYSHFPFRGYEQAAGQTFL